MSTINTVEEARDYWNRTAVPAEWNDKAKDTVYTLIEAVLGLQARIDSLQPDPRGHLED